MVKKILALLCAATIVGGSAAGVLMCIRKQKNKDMGSPAKDNEESSVDEADQAHMESTKVTIVSESDVSIENAINCETNGSQESVSRLLEEPMATHASQESLTGTADLKSGSRTLGQRRRQFSAATAVTSARGVDANTGSCTRSVPVRGRVPKRADLRKEAQEECKKPTAVLPSTPICASESTSANTKTADTPDAKIVMSGRLSVVFENDNKERCAANKSRHRTAARVAKPNSKASEAPFTEGAVKPGGMATFVPGSKPKNAPISSKSRRCVAATGNGNKDRKEGKRSKARAAGRTANRVGTACATTIATLAVETAEMSTAAPSVAVAAASSSSSRTSLVSASSQYPKQMFEERRQNESLSPEATVLFEACKVSNRELFLAKCKERFSGPQV